MTRVLILGGSGMLGHKLLQELAGDARYDVHTTVRRRPAVLGGIPATFHEGVDLSPGSSHLAEVLQKVHPDVVINAVGAIKQKDLNSAREETFFINGTLPHLIPLLNPNKSGRVVHFSTDCVFNGDRGNYSDSERPDAEDLYGRSKACGEIDYGPHLTIRTSIIGFELSGFLSLLSWLIRQPPGAALKGYTRAIYSGLPTVTLSRTVHSLLDAGIPVRGLFHVASEPISKYDLLVRLSQALQLSVSFSADSAFVMDRSLDDTPFRDATSTVRPKWDTLIDELVSDFHALPYADLAAAHTS